MRVLRRVIPTDEQLAIINRGDPGALVVRGAAGSGKTTSALHRLRFITRRFVERHQRLAIPGPVRVLVLTFNRTLRGYVAQLAENEVPDREALQLDVLTFAKWAQNVTCRDTAPPAARVDKVAQFGRRLRLDKDFLVDEVDYVLGRFLPEDLDRYLDPRTRRVGRGNSPRFSRQQLMDEVVRPYIEWKRENGFWDWNDYAVAAARVPQPEYEIVVADEVQDFCANQLRAVNAHLAQEHSATFVLDQAQQIYARGFTWQEVGINVTAVNSRRLQVNHRNTRQVAAFAAPLVRDLPLSEDATVPDMRQCRNGDYPALVLRGRYRDQIRRAFDLLDERLKPQLNADGTPRKNPDGTRKEPPNAAFMHPKGLFGDIVAELKRRRIPYEPMTRRGDWPTGEAQVGLITLHSAKGLEFDHVFLLGVNERFTQHGDGEDDSDLEKLRRLFAMAITRARESVVLGYLPAEKSVIIDYLDPETFDAEDVTQAAET